MFGKELGGPKLQVSIAGDLVRHCNDGLGALHFLLKPLGRQILIGQSFQLGEQVIVQV